MLPSESPVLVFVLAVLTLASIIVVGLSCGPPGIVAMAWTLTAAGAIIRRL